MFRKLFRKMTFVVGLLVMLATFTVMPVLAAMDDPTRPPGLGVAVSSVKSTGSKGPRWVLKSTLISPGRRTAVINNRVVSKGDRVSGATVLEIKPLSVRLSARGREVTLVMLKKNVKTLSRQSTWQKK